MSSPLANLNKNFRVVQYNGGPIYGQYGVSSSFQVEPGASTRATATRAGTTFDIVLEYTGSQGESFTLEQLVVISPKFEEVTAMLKAGVVWVHEANSPFVTNLKGEGQSASNPFIKGETMVDITYSHYFSDFHKTKVMPVLPPQSAKISTPLPIPAAVFNYGDHKGPLTIAVTEKDHGAITTGQYLHIKFTETFDDDYNVDFGHFYIVGTESTTPVKTNTPLSTDLPQYNNIVSLQQRQWLLQNGIVSTPSSLTTHNVIFTPQNSAAFFEQTSSVFISSKPIYQYLAYIEGLKPIDELPSSEQELVQKFIEFNQNAHTFTTEWRGTFASELITANLQKQTGKEMVKGNKTTINASMKQLEMPTEMVFFTIDPTTPVKLRNVALGHVGELVLSKDGIDQREKDAGDVVADVQTIDTTGKDIQLPDGRLYSIMTCSPAGPCNKFQFIPKNDHAHNTNERNKLCPHFTQDIAKGSLSPKITTFVEKTSALGSQLLTFFTRGAILSGFLHEYYDQQEQEQSKKGLSTTTTPPPKKATTTKATACPTIYTKEQIKWFLDLLQPRFLSQQPHDSTTILTHPIYSDVIISSYHGLHHKLSQMAKKEGQNGPECFLVMPLDKTTDAHLEICSNFFEFSSVLRQFQTPSQENDNKTLYPLQLGIFDVLGNNVNDCLYSYSKFLSSARLFVSLPKLQQDSLTLTTSAPSKPTTTAPMLAKVQVKKKPNAPALGKVAPALKKFTLPLNDITSLIPTIDPNTVPNTLYAVDLSFDKMIDPSMIEFAQSAEEEIPPPTIIEFVTYLAKVQGFLRTALSLGPDWCVVPLASDKSRFAQNFGAQLGKLNALLDDISYLRMLHSTIIPSVYARFTLQTTSTSLEETSEIAKNAGDENIDNIKMVNFPVDSNEDKLFRTLKGFTTRAEILLGRLPQPIGLAQVPFILPSDADIAALIEQEQIQDWDGDHTKKIPQLMTLMNGIEQTRTFLTKFDQDKLDAQQVVDIKEKMQLLRQGTDATIELLNDRVRVMVELRDCLLQVVKFIELFPSLSIELIEQNAKQPFLVSFFTMFQYVFLNTGLVYSLQQSIANPMITSALKKINTILNITTAVTINDITQTEPVFHFLDVFSPTAPVLTSSKLTELLKDQSQSIPKPLPMVTLYNAITQTADLFTQSVTSTIHKQTEEKFSSLAKTHNYVSIADEDQLQRCLEGYVLLTPQTTVSPAKSSFSRTAVAKASAAASKDNINNKKHANADDRIIVLWVTHILDGSFNHLDQLESVMKTLVHKYKSPETPLDIPQNTNNADTTPQDIVLAHVDVDQYPEILDLFDLGEPSALPALLFIQSQAERGDLRSTAIDPTELVELVQAGLVSMIDNPELYGIGGLDDDGNDEEHIGLDPDSDDDDVDAPE